MYVIICPYDAHIKVMYPLRFHNLNYLWTILLTKRVFLKARRLWKRYSTNTYSSAYCILIFLLVSTFAYIFIFWVNAWLNCLRRTLKNDFRACWFWYICLRLELSVREKWRVLLKLHILCSNVFANLLLYI